MANRWGNNGNSERFILGGSKITADGDCSHQIKRHLLLGRKVMTNLNSVLKSRDKKKFLIKLKKIKIKIKKQRHYFANKGPSGESYGFSSSHVWM